MIIRTYRCEDCSTEFEVEMESGNDGDPDCPTCSKVLDWQPGMFAVKTNKSRAIDYTQKVIENDFGLTNLNDGNREGDVAYKPPPPMQTSERDTIEQSVREFVRETVTPVNLPAAPTEQAPAAQLSTNFWGAQPSPEVQSNPIPAQLMLAGAKSGPPGVNPMEMLHKGIKSGQISSKARIIARWRP